MYTFSLSQPVLPIPLRCSSPVTKSIAEGYSHDHPRRAAYFQGRLLVSPDIWGAFGPFGYGSQRILSRSLELRQGGPRVVGAALQHINDQFVKRLVGTQLVVAGAMGTTQAH